MALLYCMLHNYRTHNGVWPRITWDHMPKPLRVLNQPPQNANSKFLWGAQRNPEAVRWGRRREIQRPCRALLRITGFDCWPGFDQTAHIWHIDMRLPCFKPTIEKLVGVSGSLQTYRRPLRQGPGAPTTVRSAISTVITVQHLSDVDDVTRANSEKVCRQRWLPRQAVKAVDTGESVYAFGSDGDNGVDQLGSQERLPASHPANLCIIGSTC